VKKNSSLRGTKILLLVLGLLAGPAVALAGEIKVSGLGWLGNHKARNNLRLLLGGQTEGAIAASAIEDAAMILFSELAGEGYLDPRLTAILTLPDGRQVERNLNARLDEPLPRPLAATAVELKIERGRRLQLGEIHFTGLHVIEEADARDFFVGETMVIPLPSARIYSPGRLRRAMANLQEELQQRGHAEAAVTLADVQINQEKGTVIANVAVAEGLPWVVGSLRFEVAGGGAPPELETAAAGARWTALWHQGLGAEIRRWYNERGFPDVRVRVVPEAGPPENGQRLVAVTARINPGIPVRLGAVRFTGNDHTRDSVLRRQVSLKPGDPLNPLALDLAQARMSRLGVFDELTLRYEPADGGVRDAVFVAKEGRRMEVNLLLGYGSYEQLRGGVEMNHYNLFGRAHTSSLKLVQSMKSTLAEHLYSVPEIFGTEVAGTARLFGVRREELSFLREEYGATVSLRWPLGKDSLTTAYSFRHLRSTHNELATSGTDDTQTNAASVELGWLRDRRDNPLTPRHGYKLFAHLEEASRVLGGQVDYQRLLLDASYHTKWGRSRWVHAGITHGLITTFGEDNDLNLPVNVRYFPGGDGSIRGYRRGEAAPRAANGQFIGAKTYLQLNLELEQALTQKFSVVAFADALGTAVRIADYPFSERLYSAGLGLRYNTLIGPLRVEYGYNLNPRPLDPRGTLHVSLGFPF
jgi:outer membrane protein insertion porin family